MRALLRALVLGILGLAGCGSDDAAPPADARPDAPPMDADGADGQLDGAITEADADRSDADSPAEIDCTTFPLGFPAEWRSCARDEDCTIGYDTGRSCAYWAVGVSVESSSALGAAVARCVDTSPPVTDCMGIPIGNTDDGHGSRGGFFRVSCEDAASGEKTCTSHMLDDGSSCTTHASCPGGALCLSDPCHRPPCPGNGFSPVCGVCGASPPCHCGYWLGFARCNTDEDCAGASCGCQDCSCDLPCIHGFCAPDAGARDLPFCD